MIISGQTFTAQTITLDGKHYIDCTMDRCTLEYHGSGPLALTDCTVNDSQIAYKDAALATVKALQAVAKSGPDGLDHVMRMFLPGSDIDWKALAKATRPAKA